MHVLLGYARDGDAGLPGTPEDGATTITVHADLPDLAEAVQRHHPDVVLLHERQGVESLAQAVERIRGAGAQVPCVLVADSYTPEVLACVARVRADGLLVRPWSLGDVAQVLGQAARSGPQPAARPAAPGTLIGDAPQMREVCRRIAAAARSNASVLITGETGTGKELVARTLHGLSPRRDKPFVAVSCAALPETLVESELFGHEKGAFTGASESRRGRFELADGGTLFLDEIGELKEAVQVKLLRVLQERVFERVGGNRSIAVDVRVVAATNRPVESLVGGEQLRPDLFYRLNVLNIHLPPLRERQGDLMPLWRHLVALAAAKDGRPVPLTAPSVGPVLQQHAWPGNIRELENVAQHAVTMSSRGVIAVPHLPPYLLGAAPPGPAAPSLSLVGMTLKDLERQAITATYAATRSTRATANMLGISLRTVHYRLKEYRAAGWSPDGPVTPWDGAVGTTPANAAGSGAARPRVLLAEDDDDLRWALEELLTQEGYEVMAVPTGTALQEHLHNSTGVHASGRGYDVIVSDLRMPGKNGLDVLASSRQHGSAVPVILISAFGDDETRARAVKLGACAFIGKPLNLEELQAALLSVTPPSNSRQ